MNEPTKTLGERIRELREAQDLSLRELARKIDVTPPFLSDIELGRRYPSEKNLTAIARILGQKVEDLRKFDTRAPVADLRRLAAAEPAYGLALRRVIDKKVTPEDLMKLAEGKPNRDRKR